MRARPSRAVSLLVTSAVLTGFLIPGVLARPEDGDPATGSEAAAPVAADFAEIPAEPPAPVRPLPTPAEDLFGADCDTVIEGSLVTAYCHNSYPQTDLVRLHVECDRWWDLDGDGNAVAVGPAGRAELVGRCWKEVRSTWVSHRRA
ncbi:hypothetical protein ACFV7Q_04905 [Streptomyces sp. NPDC059851]|uniref:hypothetical protein n=1 Tax=Streptomyces sp. NPDC059851 TaxID=3346971 RepID=UPI003657CD5F